MSNLIKSIRIEKLFGLYTYDIPQSDTLANAAILYGDNGVGKSTLLRLVFHLLSAAGNRGHRGALYKADFERLEVAVSPNRHLTATHMMIGKVKTLRLEVHGANKQLAVWDYHPREERHFWDDDQLVFQVGTSVEGWPKPQRSLKGNKARGNAPHGEGPYLAMLKRCVPTLFILNADRRLDSDSVADPSDEVELRRTMQFGEPKRINELVTRSREIALSQALASASRWINRKAVLGTNKGSMNVHSAYNDILKRLVSPSTRRGDKAIPIDVADLIERLARIDEKSSEHAKFELATHLSTQEFQKALSTRSKKKTELAAELLDPYIKSVEGRLDAVEPLYELIERFVSMLNGLLRDKTVRFKLSQGFTIKNSKGTPLTPAQLSSGEQQLLLLFCYVLTARDAPTVFMIDEPELSLNVKWQRQLVQSLLEITEGAKIQFVLASHSMELLAQHRSRVVKLVNKL